MSESSVVKSVRLPRGLTDRLTERARLEHRTVNNLITKILTEAMEPPGSSDAVPGNIAPDDKDKPA